MNKTIWKKPTTWQIFQKDDRFLLIAIGIIVGICSGFAAFVLSSCLEMMLHFYNLIRHHYLAFIIPALGAICSSLFLNKVLNEGAGHGVPEVIYSVSKHGGLLRLRSSFSRIISSCLTIGTGGSAGPEAPVVMSGAAIGSKIASFFSLNDRQRICLVGCGTSGAIASIFNAPIAGLVFTMEIILGKWQTSNIIPIAIASVSGASLSHLLSGNRVVFSHQTFTSTFTDIWVSAGLGAVAAIVSCFLYFMLTKTHSFTKKKKLPIWLKAGIGGCLVGLLGLFLPDVLGEGYIPIKSMINGNYNVAFLIVFLTCIAKVLATSLTLGSGGSGGIFAPCLVIGSFLGLAYHKGLLIVFPNLHLANEGYYALLGMAGLISGMLQAPLTGIFLILEITASYNVLLPLLVVSTFATSLSHYIQPTSFYMKELIERGQLLREGTDNKVLSDIDIKEILEKDCEIISQNLILSNFINEQFTKTKRNYFPVEDKKSGKFLGMLHFDDIRNYIFDPVISNSTLISHFMKTDIDTATIDDDLNDILHKMDKKGLYSIPIIFNGKFIGMLSKATLLDKYRTELLLQTT